MWEASTPALTAPCHPSSSLEVGTQEGSLGNPFPPPHHGLADKKAAIALAPGAEETAVGQRGLGSAGHKSGEDGDGRLRLPEVEKGGDRALILQAPDRKMSFK